MPPVVWPAGQPTRSLPPYPASRDLDPTHLLSRAPRRRPRPHPRTRTPPGGRPRPLLVARRDLVGSDGGRAGRLHDHDRRRARTPLSSSGRWRACWRRPPGWCCGVAWCRWPSRPRTSTGSCSGFHRLWIGAVAVLLVFYATGGRLSRQTLRTAVLGRRPVRPGHHLLLLGHQADDGRQRHHRRGAAAGAPALRRRPVVRRAGEHRPDRPDGGRHHRSGHRRHRLRVGRQRGLEPGRRPLRVGRPGVMDRLLHRLQAGPGEPQLARVPGRLPRDRHRSWWPPSP